MVKNVCYDIMAAYPISSFIEGLKYDNGIGTMELVLSVVYLLNACIMLFWIQQQRKRALNGVEGASMYVIFPVYIPFMWISVIADLLLSSVLLFASHQAPNYRSGLPWGNAIALAFVYGFDHFVLEGIAFVMMQYGCGYKAAKRSAIWASWWGIVTFFAQLVNFKRGGDTPEGMISLISWNVIQLIFYAALWLLPDRLLFRRPALIFFSKFWFIFRLLYFLSEIMISFSDKGSLAMAIGYCGDFSINCIIFALCKPFIIYYTLLSDSKWWQGIGHHKPISISSNNSHSSHSSARPDSPNILYDIKRADKIKYEQLRNPLMGIEVGFNEAQDLAEEVDNLRFHGSVKLLNFAYLSIEKKSTLLGSGSSSRVYSGKYKQGKVAIKMLFTPDLNPDVIRRCSKEAQLLSEIKDPNVVHIYGVSVLPPSVCIVLEHCQYGSLSDVIRGSATTKTPSLQLSLVDRMWLALGCVRGLRALHGNGNSLCHRDIKSFNFLVDSNLTVKLADLELGVNFDDLNPEEKAIQNSKKYVSQNDIMASWQSPESIRGETYNQSCDIFSMSIVLWEIITTYVYFQTRLEIKNSSFEIDPLIFGKIGIPFSEFPNQAAVREQICLGTRPHVPEGLDAEYVNIMTRGWDEDPSIRPDASEMVSVMTHCWQQCVYRHLKETSHTVDLSVVKGVHNQQLLSKHSLRQISESHSGSLTKSPSAFLLSALSSMQQESGFLDLESNGPILVIGAEDPYLILWATKKWSKLTGFILNDILASNVSIFEGPESNRTILSQCLYSASKGESKHMVTTHYRRDGSAFKNSLHIFPVFKKLPPTVRKNNGNINLIETTINSNSLGNASNLGIPIANNLSSSAASNSIDKSKSSLEQNMIFGSCISDVGEKDRINTTMASSSELSTKDANTNASEETSSLLLTKSPEELKGQYKVISNASNSPSNSSNLINRGKSTPSTFSQSPTLSSLIFHQNNNKDNNNSNSESNNSPSSMSGSSLFSKLKTYGNISVPNGLFTSSTPSQIKASISAFNESPPIEVCYIVLHFNDFENKLVKK